MAYLNFNAEQTQLSVTDDATFEIVESDEQLFTLAAQGASISRQLSDERHGVALAQTFTDLSKCMAEMNAKMMNGASLKRARKLLKLNQKQMGDSLGLSKTSVCIMERKPREALKQRTAIAVECLLRRANLWERFAHKNSTK